MSGELSSMLNICFKGAEDLRTHLNGIFLSRLLPRLCRASDSPGRKKDLFDSFQKGTGCSFKDELLC